MAKAYKRTVFIILIFSLSLFLATRVYATGNYGSWVRGTTEYTNAVGESSVEAVSADAISAENAPVDDDPNPIEKFFAGLVVSLGSSIRKALKAGGIDASTTGIIMGKITNGVSYFVFDLSDENLWGIIGSYIFVFFRNLAFSLIFIFITVRIGKNLIFGGDRGLADMKDAIYTFILFILLLYLMPQVVDWVCEARDLASIKLFNFVSGLIPDSGSTLAESVSLEETYYNLYGADDGHRTLLNAAIYLGVCIIPFFYLISYLGIAFTQTVLFGFFPLVLVLSTQDKKAITTWCTVVFTNCLIPMIDMLLILLPGLMLSLIGAASGSEEFDKSILKAIITMTMFMLIMPSRNKILSALGNNFSGVKGGFGIGALAGMGALAAKALAGMKKSKDGGGESKGDDAPSSQEANASDEEAGKSLSDLQQTLGDVGGASLAENAGGNDDDGTGDAGPKEMEDIPGSEDNDEFATGDEATENENERLEGGDAAEEEVPGDETDETVNEDETMEGGPVNLNDVEGTETDKGPTDQEDYDPSPKGAETDMNEKTRDLNPVKDAPGGGEDTEVNPRGAESDMNDQTRDLNPIGGSSPEPVNVTPDSTPDTPSGELKASPQMNDDISSTSSEDSAAAVAEADKLIHDATVNSADLEKDADKEGSLGNEISANSPETASKDQPNLDKNINMARAANLQTMDNLRDRSNYLDKETASAQAAIASDANLMSRNAAKLKSLDQKEKSILDKYDTSKDPMSAYNPKPRMSEEDAKTLSGIREERAQLETANQNAQENINAAKSKIAANSVAKQAIGAELARRGSVEQEFGALQAKRGLDGKTFNSAQDFKRQVVHDNRVRQTANYKNFADAKYSGILTPQERSQFKREQNIRRVVGQTAGNLAKGAALTAVGGVSMVALSVGGENAVAAGAAVTAMGVGHIAKAGATAAPAVGGAVATAGAAAGAKVGEVGARAASAVGAKAAGVNAKIDGYFGSEKWVDKNNPYGKKKITRKERDAKLAANGSPNGSPFGGPSGGGPSGGGMSSGTEAETFRREGQFDSNDKVIRDRYEKANAEANSNVRKFEDRTK